MKTEPRQAEVCDEDKDPAEVAGVTSEPDLKKDNDEDENDAPHENFEEEDSDVEEQHLNKNQALGTTKWNKLSILFKRAMR